MKLARKQIIAKGPKKELENDKYAPFAYGSLVDILCVLLKRGIHYSLDLRTTSCGYFIIRENSTVRFEKIT